MNIREQFLAAIAFAGDLTMGQPPEHSPTTAILAAKIAKIDGATPSQIAQSAQLGMIRWGGCTANAEGFAGLFGDDILGRREVLAGRDPFVAKPLARLAPKTSLLASFAPYLPFVPKPAPEAIFYGKIMPLVYSHCEVVAEIATRAQFPAGLIAAIGDLFEYWDGSGWPLGKNHQQFDASVQHVWLANDIEAFCRFHGVTEAAAMIRARAGGVYDAELVAQVLPKMTQWLDEIRDDNVVARALRHCCLGDDPQGFDAQAAILLLSDFADLKRPQLTGMSRMASQLAMRVATQMGRDVAEVQAARDGTLLSTLGYVSVTSAAFERNSRSDMESIRLVPYWTERILSRAPDLQTACVVAGQVFERLDGSGWHKGLTAAHLGMPARIAQVAMVVAEQQVQPGRETADHLIDLAEKGQLDPEAVAATLAELGVSYAAPNWEAKFGITPREKDVLTRLVQGKSNKEIARALAISPKTVGTHLENCYRKMGVTTRAAAAIKALDAGIVGR